ncbi:helix-turn-helix transcriptional regulator [Thalassiella azotivora]
MPRATSTSRLVGRREQLETLRVALGEAASRRPATVLVGGDAGAGKTRLVEELVREAASDGALVLVGHCLDLGDVGLPYLPFSEALSHARRTGTADLDAVTGRHPALAGLVGGGPVASDDEVGRLQLFEAVAAALRELGEQAPGPVLLVLEDVHWADPSTRDLLRFLVARARDQRLLVLATYRSDDLHRRHPLRPLLAELVRHPAVERVEVPPFTPEELREFADVVTGGTASDAVVRGVVERSEGNAYFAQELLEAGEDGWCGPRAALPETLSDVLLARVDRLDAAVVELVRVASVAGRRVAEPLLAAALGRGAAELEPSLRAAVAHQVLVAVDGGYAFRHALLGEAVYADLLPGERVRVHAAYGAALADPTLGSAAELAHHCRAAQDLPGALSASLAAAQEATRRFAPAETLRHLETALSLWDAVPDAPQRAGGGQDDLLLRAAAAAHRAGELDRSAALSRQAVHVAADRGDAATEAVARLHLAQDLLALEQPGALDQTTRALARLTGPGTALASPRPPTGTGPDGGPDGGPEWAADDRTTRLLKAASVHARVSLSADRDDDARAWATWALEGTRTLGLTSVEADLLTTLAVLAEPETATDLLRRALEVARRGGVVGVELRASYNLAANLYYGGAVPQALATLGEARERAERAGARWSSWGLELRVLEVIARYLHGDWEGSASVASLVGTSAPPDLVAARLSAAGLYVRVGRGDPDAVRDAEGLRPAWGRDGQIALVGGGVLVDALTWQGRYADAVTVAREVVDHLTRTWNDYFLGGIWLSALAVAALADQAAAARGRGAPDDVTREADDLLQLAQTTAERGRPRLGRLGPEGRAWVARVRAEHARAHGRAEPALWQEAVDAFGDGYPYEQARSRYRLAESLLETGRRDEAVEELAAARRAARDLGAEPLAAAVVTLARRARVPLPPTAPRDEPPAPLPARGPSPPGPPGPPSPLTPREAAVLALVAEGLTNRQAGERLFISEKTVSVHLSNLMTKLGATGRTEAVSIAHRRGLLAGAGHDAAGSPLG